MIMYFWTIASGKKGLRTTLVKADSHAPESVDSCIKLHKLLDSKTGERFLYH